MEEIKLGLYRHFKGDIYEVLGTAQHSETMEELVIYRNIEKGYLWARPAKMWNETIERGGQVFQRFTYLGIYK